jgi:sec-independent protein translocase protein TatB
VFENLNWWEIGTLLLLALLIFGDKLPNVISDGLRMLRNLRAMARNATGDLSRELGTDIQLEDLHPKTFIRKHLLSEEDEQALRKPLQGVYDSLRDDLTGVHNELKDVASAADLRSASANGSIGSTNGSTPSVNGSTGSAANGSAANGARSLDVDAT